MYQMILIATDGSELSEKAARSGLQLAKMLDAGVVVVNVSRPYHSVITLGGVDVMARPEAFDEQCEAAAARVLSVVEKDASDLGVPCRTRHIIDDHEWRAIIDAAVQYECDLIHMGSHGRSGFEALILGSQTQKVLTHSQLPVLIHR